jgi:predicted ATPase
MGIHTGEAQERDGDYFGPALNRAARLAAIGHGGQVLVSQTTEQLARDAFVDVSVELRALGEHRLRDLSRPERVFQVVAAGLEVEFPALESMDTFPSNLPVQLTSFVGRAHELAEVRDALGTSRVVTLTGVGGVGKTRLALQTAAAVISDFRDGAWLVELAPAVDGEALSELIAGTLQVAERTGQSRAATLEDFLRGKRLLLVLDNCEHLVDAVADFVERTVSVSPHVVVLATSREGLGVAGERILTVRSLSLPSDVASDEASEAEAVRLFVDRAHSASDGFVLSDANVEDVARLVRRLDGIPLAIELAAARARSLTPSDLADRLDERFQLLAGGRRTAVERHQTLRRAIDWSYELLSATEQHALDRLAVFSGDFSLPAAEEVIAGDLIDPVDVLDLLGRLVDKSLLLAEDTDGETRYRLLETIRQYAQEQLEASGDAEVFRRRHAFYFGALAEELGRGMRGRDEAIWTAGGERELDNLRGALTWSVANDEPDPALGIVAALALNGTRIGYATGPWAQLALLTPSASVHRLYPQVLAWAGWDQAIQGDLDGACRTCGEALDAAKEADLGGPGRCRVLACVAGVAGFGNRSDDITALTEEWIAIARTTGDDYELAQALSLAAFPVSPLAEGHDPARAVALTDEALAAARRLGNPTAIGYAAQCAAFFTFDARPQTALELFSVALAAAESVGNQLGIAVTLGTQAFTQATMGNWTDAAPLALRSVQHAHRAGDRANLAGGLAMSMLVMSHFGVDEPAALLYGTPQVAFQLTLGGPGEQQVLLAEMELRDRLGDERFTRLVARGSALDQDEAVELACREVGRLIDQDLNDGED